MEEAAVLADEFVLMHAGNFSEKGHFDVNVKQNPHSLRGLFVTYIFIWFAITAEKGKKDCPALRYKSYY